jgi:hypothetical protein
MKKMNQQSINKILFYKLFENINEAEVPGPTQFPPDFQPPLLAPQDFQVPLETPTRKPTQKPIKPGQPFDLEETETPDQEFDKIFNRDKFYEIWKDFWEQRNGTKNKELMDSEFERMLEQLRRDYLRLRRERILPNGTRGQTSLFDAFGQIIKKFYRYFTDPEIYA